MDKLVDMRKKHDWRQFEGALKKISNLTHFGSYVLEAAPDIRSVGLSAQEVREVLPEAVEVGTDGKYYLSQRISQFLRTAGT